MKDNFIHVCFIVDKSGSMFSSTDDVIGGFKSIVEEQRQVKDGKCAISLYTFDDYVNEVYVGKDVNEIEDFKNKLNEVAEKIKNREYREIRYPEAWHEAALLNIFIDLEKIATAR